MNCETLLSTWILKDVPVYLPFFIPYSSSSIQPNEVFPHFKTIIILTHYSLTVHRSNPPIYGHFPPANQTLSPNPGPPNHPLFARSRSL